MKNIIFVFKILIISFILVSCSSNEPKNEIVKNQYSEKYNVAVLGFENDIGNKEWEDNRIGFGLRVKLSEILYETNRFEMIEEKSEIKQKLEEISKLMWLSKDIDYKNYIKLDEIDYIAYGKVYYFGKPRRNASIGLVQLNKNITEIKVEITLENVKTGKKISEKGFGKAEVESNSIIFTYNEERAEFDKTTVGIATEQALKEALNNIMKKLK